MAEDGISRTAADSLSGVKDWDMKCKATRM